MSETTPDDIPAEETPENSDPPAGYYFQEGEVDVQETAAAEAATPTPGVAIADNA